MFTIKEFCTYARISRTFYYDLRRKGKGPAETRIGSRVLISRDTAKDWLKALEGAA